MPNSAAVTDGSLVFSATNDGKILQKSSGGEQVLEPPERLFRKTSLTRAARIPGPFTVETSEGPLHCEDGWLAVDARGYPYPIAADEFEKIYEPAEREHGVPPDPSIGLP